MKPIDVRKALPGVIHQNDGLDYEMVDGLMVELNTDNLDSFEDAAERAVCSALIDELYTEGIR